MGQLKVANDDSENENDSEVQFQNKDASFQSAIDENDDKKDTFETAKTAENAVEMSSDNDLLAFTPKNVPAASSSIIKLFFCPTKYISMLRVVFLFAAIFIA